MDVFNTNRNRASYLTNSTQETAAAKATAKQITDPFADLLSLSGSSSHQTESNP